MQRNVLRSIWSSVCRRYEVRINEVVCVAGCPYARNDALRCGPEANVTSKSPGGRRCEGYRYAGSLHDRICSSKEMTADGARPVVPMS